VDKQTEHHSLSRRSSSERSPILHPSRARCWRPALGHPLRRSKPFAGHALNFGYRLLGYEGKVPQIEHAQKVQQVQQVEVTLRVVEVGISNKADTNESPSRSPLGRYLFVSRTSRAVCYPSPGPSFFTSTRGFNGGLCCSLTWHWCQLDSALGIATLYC
jgi:hypothetical protein